MSPKGKPLATRLIVFFAGTPEMGLSADEIARKYDTPRKHVSTTLRYAVRNGWLRPEGRRNPVYRAGPTLLEEL